MLNPFPCLADSILHRLRHRQIGIRRQSTQHISDFNTARQSLFHLFQNGAKPPAPAAHRVMYVIEYLSLIFHLRGTAHFYPLRLFGWLASIMFKNGMFLIGVMEDLLQVVDFRIIIFILRLTDSDLSLKCAAVHNISTLMCYFCELLVSHIHINMHNPSAPLR